MNTPSVALGLLLYSAFAVFFFGTLWRLWIYARTPAPYKIPTTPAPVTRAGVAWRLLKETVWFESLLKADRVLWVLAWVFHAALLLVLLEHWRIIAGTWPGWILRLSLYAPYISTALLVSVGGLWLRRLVIDRVRYISAPSDHLMLALIAAIVISGMTMKYLDPVDVWVVTRYLQGLTEFSFRPLPEHALLIVHLTLVALLLAVFPFSKLMHGPALYFSPTRYQVDDPRERHRVPRVDSVRRTNGGRDG